MRMLIDADLVLYQRMAAAENEFNFGNDMWGLTCDHRQALAHVAADIADYAVVLNRWDPSQTYVPVLCFSSERNWRKERVTSTYKEKRKGKRKPLGWKAAIDVLSGLYQTELRDELEGDDVMGILATNPANAGKVIVISGDKDLKTIPGLHLDPKNLDADPVLITKNAADRWWMMQTLMGDTADGYPGCKGVGAKGAEKLLPSLEEWDMQTALEAVLKAFGDAETMWTQSLLARILRHTEWKTSSGGLVASRIPSYAFCQTRTTPEEF